MAMTDELVLLLKQQHIMIVIGFAMLTFLFIIEFIKR
jgi:hypothetical protein